LPFSWPGRKVHFLAASRAAVLTKASPKAPLGANEITSALCTLPEESTMTRMETVGGGLKGMLRGILGATRWIGTGSAILPETVGATATGVGDVLETAAGATVGAGKEGAEADGRG